MSKHALFLQHAPSPALETKFKKYGRNICSRRSRGNGGHEVYVYSFGSDPDRICAFQVYSSVEEASAFLKSQAYIDYEREVAPLLEGPPQVEVLRPQWIKGIR